MPNFLPSQTINELYMQLVILASSERNASKADAHPSVYCRVTGFLAEDLYKEPVWILRSKIFRGQKFKPLNFSHKTSDHRAVWILS